MGFLNPWMLLGLGGIAVPIAIHLLNRFRPRRIPWGAMELLRRAAVLRSRQVRIEDLLLLLLRCLALILIALALARPTMRGAGARLLGGAPDAAVLIAIDVAYGMEYRAAAHARFDRAIDRVRRILATLDPGHPVTLVTLGARPRVLLRQTGYQEDQVEEILAGLRPRPEALNLEAGLAELEPLAHEMTASSVECYIVSGMSRRHWERLSETGTATLARLTGQARLFLVPVGEDRFENLAITRFERIGGSLRRGTSIRYRVEVANVGASTQTGVVVRLAPEDGMPGDQQVIPRLEPGERASVPLTTRFDRAGQHRVRAVLEPDGLARDNERALVAVVRDSLRVLLVDGAPHPDRFRSATGYLRTALQPRPAVARDRGAIEVDVVPWTAFVAPQLVEADVVILAQPPDLRAVQAEALATFVEQGGGLLVMLGDGVDPTVLNERLRIGETGLLPAVIGAPRGDAEARDGGEPVALADSGHPVTRLLEPLPAALWDEVRIWRWFELEPAPGAAVLLRAPGADAPLLVEHRVGGGRVMLFAGTGNLDWTNLMLSPVGPVLLHQSIAHLTRLPTEDPYQVGRPITVALPAAGTPGRVTVRNPEGDETTLQVAERNGRRSVEFVPELAGFFEIRDEHAAAPIRLAVNVDPAEGDAAAWPVPELSAWANGLPGAAAGAVRVLADVAAMDAAIREARVGRELWRGLLIAGLLVLVLEAALARRFTRRSAAGPIVPGDVPGRMMSEGWARMGSS